MEKLSSHYSSPYFTYIVNSTNVCFVILIVWFEIYATTFGAMSTEFSATSSPAYETVAMSSESPISASTSPNILPITTVAATPSNCKTTTAIKGWQCHCWNATKESILACCCEGPAVLFVPQILPTDVQRLNILNAGLKTLRFGLRHYSSSLEDIVFKNLPQFDSIEAGAFATLDNLRSIEISHAPKLKHLPANVFEYMPPSLKSLRILNCGLTKVPDMRFLSTGTILNMVDLEGNRIEVIDRKSVNIRTEHLILDNNALTYIYDSAFYGSEIAKLSLKGNQKLREIHPSAFAGILNIIELDLSSTSIESLPTDGLENLEFLRIQNTYTLKTVPSVYTFENLKGAWLTHSFHCCAFKFPQRHNPLRHAQRIQYLAELRKRCVKKNFKYENKENATSGGPKFALNITSVDGDNNAVGNMRRLRRFTDYFYNHFEDQRIGEISHNKTLEYQTFDNTDAVLTVSPVIYKENVESETSTYYINDNMEDGEFLDTTAEVVPNQIKEATCGALISEKTEVECYPIPNALNPCEDVMGSQWLRSSVWVVVFLAVFGNVAVLLVLFSNWNDVTVPKFLMCHLAFADLCLGLYLLLIAAIDIHSMGEFFNFAYDWQYGIGCKVAGFLTVFASHLSVFTLTVITIERWYAITHAINLNKRIKLTSASFIMICGWMYSIVMSSLPLFGVSNYSSTSICLPMEAMDLSDVVYLVSIMSANGFAFSIIAICYARIYFSLGKETRQVARNASRGEMTVAKKMALLVFTNFACWAPIAFFGLTALAGLPLIDVAKSKILLVFFYPLNSCADPYLYAILTTQYRRDLFTLLSKYGFFTQKAQQYKMNYSFPTTNHTCPVPLIDRRSSSISGPTAKPKHNEEEHLNEEFV